MLFQNVKDGLHRQTLKSYLEESTPKIRQQFKYFYAFIIEKEGKFNIKEWWVIRDRPYSLRVYGEVISKNPAVGKDPMSSDLRHYSWQDIELEVTPCRKA